MMDYAVKFTKKAFGKLSLEERNILSVAFKNVVGSRRASWRVLTGIENKKKGQAEKIQKYKQVIEQELQTYCNMIVGLIDSLLLNASKSYENKAFYQKMKADYYRYLAEFQKGKARDFSSSMAGKAYHESYKIVTENFPATHPIRLGLMLSHSVYYYEIMQQQEKGIEIAKKAFNDANSDIDNITDDSYKDATLIVKLLKENLDLWTADSP